MDETGTSQLEYIIHMDLNKTILAVDEVKGYGREAIILLETYKKHEGFKDDVKKDLIEEKKYIGKGDLGGKPLEKNKVQDLINEFETSSNEPTLIECARIYDVEGGENVLQKTEDINIDENNCVESFWNFINFLKNQNALLIFRTYGSELGKIYEQVKAKHDDLNPIGQLAVIHKLGEDGLEATGLFKKREKKDTNMNVIEYEYVNGIVNSSNIKKDIVNIKAQNISESGSENGIDYFYPNNTEDGKTPGPKQSGTKEYEQRTTPMELFNAEMYESGENMEPFFVDITEENRDTLNNKDTDSDEVHRIYEESSIIDKESLINTLKQMYLDNGNSGLKIMGIQDNYRPWSRKNPDNGKPFIIDDSVKQIFFDDYPFSQVEGMGSYINAIYKDRDDEKKLKLLSNKDINFLGDYKPNNKSKEPNINNQRHKIDPNNFIQRVFLINKKSQKATSSGNPDYFENIFKDAFGVGTGSSSVKNIKEALVKQGLKNQVSEGLIGGGSKKKKRGKKNTKGRKSRKGRQSRKVRKNKKSKKKRVMKGKKSHKRKNKK